jgi:hypothetical protein
MLLRGFYQFPVTKNWCHIPVDKIGVSPFPFKEVIASSSLVGDTVKVVGVIGNEYQQ